MAHSVAQGSVTGQMRRKVMEAMLYICLTLGSVVMMWPFVWMILSSTKSSGEILRLPPSFLPEFPSVKNYTAVLGEMPFSRYFFNSVLVSICVTSGVLFTSSLGGYVFGKFSFPGREALFTLILGTMMIPFQVTVVPLYLIVLRLGLYNSYGALIVPALVNAFGIFMMRQFMHEVPDELLDAARIDGASEYRIYGSIVIPLLRPALTTLGILTFTWSWNSFLWPVIAVASDEYRTVQLALASFVSFRNLRYGLLMAASTMAVVPILVIFTLLQRGIMRGVAMTGLKG